jgi:hypothetical protein
MTATTFPARRRPSGFHSAARRVARLGFWFFLVKGLLWLTVPLAAWLATGP